MFLLGEDRLIQRVVHLDSTHVASSSSSGNHCWSSLAYLSGSFSIRSWNLSTRSSELMLSNSIRVISSSCLSCNIISPSVFIISTFHSEGHKNLYPDPKRFLQIASPLPSRRMVQCAFQELEPFLVPAYSHGISYRLPFV